MTCTTFVCTWLLIRLFFATTKLYSVAATSVATLTSLFSNFVGAALLYSVQVLLYAVVWDGGSYGKICDDVLLRSPLLSA